mmetsp:Transcript_6435/g.14548  ORF Transcript_6435/g.14548 Transcript_6435/m.14548 type:complete len:379 (+) Transcript_6435:330-1466(+)
MSGTPFCTTGGMMLNSPPVDAHRRALGGWDAGPVVPPDGRGEGSGGRQPQPAEGMSAPEHDMSGHMDHMDHGHHMSGMGGMGGGGTVMYMDGFRSALFPSPDYPPPPCFNLFSSSWTLATRPSFALAMVVVTAIGVLVEACGVWRVRSLRRGREIRREARARIAEQRMPPPERLATFQQQSQFISRSELSDVSDRFEEEPAAARGGPGRLRRLLCRLCPAACAREGTPGTRSAKAAKRHETLAAGLHAARALLGYLLMLAVMSYAVEFLLCACLGMVLGRHYYAETEGGGVNVGGGIGGMQPEGRHSGFDAGAMGMTGLTGGGGRRQHDDAAWGGGGDPCCGLDDGDDDDDDDMPLEEPLLARHQNGLTRRGQVEAPS